MRQHLTLIIEHDDEDRVGLIKSYDSRKTVMSKNEVTEIQKFDEENERFYVAGKEVSLGYVDFEDEDDYEERFGEEAKRKLREIDEQWLDQAGIELEATA